MLFKVYDKRNMWWWAKKTFEIQPIAEQEAYIFNTESKEDMHNFHEEDCFDKVDCVIKVVNKKGE